MDGMAVFRSLRGAIRSPGSQALLMPRALVAPQGAIAIRLRPMRADDAIEWSRLRERNRSWLQPWDSGDPMHGPGFSFNEWIERQHRAQRAGTAAQFFIEYRMSIVGQVSVGAISYGAMRCGSVGYWVDEGHAGLGIAPMAVALLADWAMLDAAGSRLHRLEIAMLPENRCSKRVAEKLGRVMKVCVVATCTSMALGAIMKCTVYWLKMRLKALSNVCLIEFRPSAAGIENPVEVQ